LWQGHSVARGEHPGSHGSFVPYAKRPGTMTLFASGAVPPIRSSTKSDFLPCGLDTNLFHQIGEQISNERRAGSTALNKGIAEDAPNFHDPSLSNLLRLLRDEAKSGGPSGPLYAEPLAHALAVRLFTLTKGGGNESGHHAGGHLHPKIISQIIERVEANPRYRFDLDGLAAEAGYSYSRFLCAFHSSTGFLPTNTSGLRLDRAKQLMRNRSLTLLEIALECGFASHAHLSYALRQRFGLVPSQFRRDL
jgi:AraC family transcriptional regulator